MIYKYIYIIQNNNKNNNIHTFTIGCRPPLYDAQIYV